MTAREMRAVSDGRTRTSEPPPAFVSFAENDIKRRRVGFDST